LDSAEHRLGAANTGEDLAVMEVSGGSQSFNAVNQLRILGRWMRMITIPISRRRKSFSGVRCK